MSKLVGVTGVRALLPIVWQLGFALGSVVGGLRWAGIARVILISMGTLTGVGGTTGSIISSCQQNPSTCNLRCLFGLLCPPPIVKLIELSPTSQSSPQSDPNLAKFKIQFSRAITGIDVNDLKLMPSESVTGLKLIDIVPENANTNKDTYIASANTGTGEGTMRIELKDDDSIKSDQGVPLGGDGLGNGDFSSSDYPISRPAPTLPPFVDSIKPVDPNPTKQPEVSYDVQFNQDVTGVDLADFQLSRQPSIPDAQISRLQERSPSLYRVFITTGAETNSGCFHLNLVDDDSIKNREGIPLGGVGAGNGNASGDLYSKVVCGALW